MPSRASGTPCGSVLSRFCVLWLSDLGLTLDVLYCLGAFLPISDSGVLCLCPPVSAFTVFVVLNPPRPCASKRVEAPTGQQTLQTLENKLPRGRVSLPLPPPSGPARSLAAGSRFLVAPLTLQKCFKNQYFFNISAFWPHQAPTYTPHSPKWPPNNEKSMKKTQFRRKIKEKTTISTKKPPL